MHRGGGGPFGVAAITGGTIDGVTDLKVYNGTVDTVNGEFIEAVYAANVATILSSKVGGGTARTLTIGTGGTVINFQLAGTNRWQISSSHLLPVADNTYDIGNGSQRVRVAYLNMLQGTNTKTLTETSATAFVALTIANSTAVSGYIDYTVFAADATNTQAKSGRIDFSAAATNAGAVTAASLSDVNTLNPCTTGTLTNTMTQATGANSLTFSANATSSLTQTTLEVRYRVVLTSGTATVTPQ